MALAAQYLSLISCVSSVGERPCIWRRSCPLDGGRTFAPTLCRWRGDVLFLGEMEDTALMASSCVMITHVKCNRVPCHALHHRVSISISLAFGRYAIVVVARASRVEEERLICISTTAGHFDLSALLPAQISTDRAQHQLAPRSLTARQNAESAGCGIAATDRMSGLARSHHGRQSSSIRLTPMVGTDVK